MLDHTEYQRRPSTSSSLTKIIGDVRARWRMKLALRGVTRSVGAAVVLFFVAAYGLEWARFSPASIIAARVSSTSCELVVTTIPSVTGIEQAVCSFGIFSTRTTHIRHEA